MADPILSVPLRFARPAEAPARRGEPVTVGLPWPRGAVRDDRQFRLVGPDGSPQVLQTQVLDRWPDGSVRWGLFDFLATVGGPAGEYRVEVAAEPVADRPADLPVERVEEVGVVVDTGAARVTVNKPGDHLLRADLGAGPAARRVTGFLYHPIHGVEGQSVRNPAASVPDVGPVRVRVGFAYDACRRGPAPDGSQDAVKVRVVGHLDLFRGSAVARVRVTVRNPRPAAHPGGNWDLGADGAVYLRHLGFLLSAGDGNGEWAVRVSPSPGEPARAARERLTVHQDASGGPNWQSVNHLNRHRKVPQRFNGYELAADDEPKATGPRATPVVTLAERDRFLGLAVPRFWENFPATVRAERGAVSVDLFTDEGAPETELQGGEQKTWTFYVAFGKDAVTDEPLVWGRTPLLCHADPEWYAASGAVPYLTPKAADPHAGYLALVDQAIDGPDTFFNKREKIDEYGWRHFGDVSGDHEAVFWPGPDPMVSHYNNQYDCVAGFLYQFLRSGDPRWWELAVPCADHTCDIDVYHTDGDKAAYNRGLFWHTYHYAPADTGTHRSYPRSLRTGGHFESGQDLKALGETGKSLTKAYAVGGGPAASHNYNHGLMLAYFLTGNPLYKDTAVDLARFVIGMEDPARTPFRWLSREFTGLATESGGGGYHGPGRASGNSVLALLVGHQLTGDRAFLLKAEQLIRRVAHPDQNLDKLDLLNAELRWFYTMFLQALGRYLDYKAELGELDRMYAYGRLTLLHYARWMAEHERPILDNPDKLQYPTETWAAQDMRKAEVFQYAAKHAAGDEKARLLERAEWFFRYVERTLPTFPTKSLCRPVVLMLNFGWSRAWWQRHPDAAAPEPAVAASAGEFGEWRMFVPQKAKAVRRAKRIAAAGAAGAALAAAAGVWWLVRT